MHRSGGEGRTWRAAVYATDCSLDALDILIEVPRVAGRAAFRWTSIDACFVGCVHLGRSRQTLAV